MKKPVKRIRKDEFAACWSERESETERALVVILRTSGCAWAAKGGCLMCGYSSESVGDVGQEDIEKQVAKALERRKGEEIVKIYTSGSFLDPGEISEPAAVLEKFLASGARRLLVESRPEFVAAAMPWLGQFRGRLEVAMGLESASDRVRDACVRKGFSFDDFASAAEKLRGAGISVRTYLLLKPPFLGEGDAVADAKGSIARAAPYSDTISLNPVNVQRRTAVERMWRRAEYRPPWLWSLVEVLATAEKGGSRLVSSPSGGGTPRGVHNCGKCDDALLKAVEQFSFTQDASAFNGLECTCRERWKDVLELERFAMTAVDVERISQRE